MRGVRSFSGRPRRVFRADVSHLRLAATHVSYLHCAGCAGCREVCIREAGRKCRSRGIRARIACKRGGCTFRVRSLDTPLREAFRLGRVQRQKSRIHFGSQGTKDTRPASFLRVARTPLPRRWLEVCCSCDLLERLVWHVSVAAAADTTSHVLLKVFHRRAALGVIVAKRRRAHRTRTLSLPDLRSPRRLVVEVRATPDRRDWIEALSSFGAYLAVHETCIPKASVRSSRSASRGATSFQRVSSSRAKRSRAPLTETGCSPRPVFARAFRRARLHSTQTQYRLLRP